MKKNPFIRNNLFCAYFWGETLKGLFSLYSSTNNYFQYVKPPLITTFKLQNIQTNPNKTHLPWKFFKIFPFFGFFDIYL